MRPTAIDAADQILLMTKSTILSCHGSKCLPRATNFDTRRLLETAMQTSTRRFEMATQISKPLSIEQIRGLVDSPQEAARHVVPLLQVVAGDDDERSGWAADALASIDVLDSLAASQVCPLCSSESVATAAWACKMLARAVPQVEAYEQAIASVLTGHGAISAQQAAAAALGSLPALSFESTVALRQAARSQDPRLSRLATQALEATPAD